MRPLFGSLRRLCREFLIFQIDQEVGLLAFSSFWGLDFDTLFGRIDLDALFRHADGGSSQPGKNRFCHK